MVDFSALGSCVSCFSYVNSFISCQVRHFVYGFCVGRIVCKGAVMAVPWLVAGNVA